MGIQEYSSEEKGSIYEYYVGQHYSGMGYNVLYTGIVYGPGSHNGIDMIAYNERDKKMILIQCKYRKTENANINYDVINEFKSDCEAFIKQVNPSYDVALVIAVNWASIANQLRSKAETMNISIVKIYDDSLNSITPEMVEKIRIEKKREYPENMNFLVSKFIPIKRYDLKRKLKQKYITIIIMVAILVAIGIVIYFNRTVYYAPYSGMRYHNTLNCEGLEDAISIEQTTYYDARIRHGLTPCGYCRRLFDF